MRVRIASVAAALPCEPEAQRVPPDNYHLTLAFVGEVAPAGLAELQQIGGSQRAPGCTFTLDTYEYWREPRVLVAIARQIPPEMLQLWTQLRRALAQSQAGLRCEPKPPTLRAHVTLARKVAQAPVLQAMSPIEWTSREFSLVRSDTSGARAVYTVVDTWSLLDEASAR
jgi:2'-5' RNA ligase